MPFSNGVLQRLRSWVSDRNNSIKIMADLMDGEFDNVVGAVNDVVSGVQPFTGSLKVPFGTTAAPGIQFSGDNDTGIARTAPDTLSLVAGGAPRANVTPASLAISAPTLALPDGAVAAPGLSFGADLNTGFFRPAADTLALSLGGSEVLRWAPGGVTGPLSMIAVPNQFKIMNGNFLWNQRSVASGSGSMDFTTMTADRWGVRGRSGTNTHSFNLDVNAEPIGHLFSRLSMRLGTGFGSSPSFDCLYLFQRIESVRNYAGQVVTLFGWGKRSTAGPMAVSIVQNFGTGGTPSAPVTTYAGQVTLGTSWAPWRLEIAVPTIAGKVYGTSDDGYLEIRLWASAGSDFTNETGNLGTQYTEVHLANLHERLGRVPIEAVNFYQQPDIIDELLRCQRYYTKLERCARVSSTSPSIGQITFPVRMRTTPDIESISYASGSGATWNPSPTGMVQISTHSAISNVSEVRLNAEL